MTNLFFENLKSDRNLILELYYIVEVLLKSF